jgi:hypothetical protein
MRLEEKEYHEYLVRIPKHPDLFPPYYKEWGKINTRKKKKVLKELGIKKRHFAIYDDTVIASGKNLKEVEKIVIDLFENKRHGRLFIILKYKNFITIQFRRGKVSPRLINRLFF